MRKPQLTPPLSDENKVEIIGAGLMGIALVSDSKAASIGLGVLGLAAFLFPKETVMVAKAMKEMAKNNQPSTTPNP